MPAAVIFDLDGVLMDSEQRWNGAKEALVRETGGHWREEAPSVMMGMSSSEWAAYLRDDLGVPLDAEEISRDVVRRMEDGYRASLPLLPGADDAVRALAAHWPLGLASSSNREIIDRVLAAGGIAGCFRATASSEEVAAGKPAPDVYLEVARRLGVDPPECAAVEDSHNGIRSAKAAGMRCIAIPNAHFPPGDAVEEADATVRSLDELTSAVLVA